MSTISVRNLWHEYGSKIVLERVNLKFAPRTFGALDPGTKDSIHELVLRLWNETGMTVFLVTHDIREGFKLGTRLLVFDKVRIDPHAPERYGATVTYDMDL